MFIPVPYREEVAMARDSNHAGANVDLHFPLAATIGQLALAVHLRRKMWARTHCDLYTEPSLRG
jgi:hypothetical protein